MSDDGPEWFAPKRYGFGAGLPVSWQGWAITIGFMAISIALALRFREKPLLFIAALVPIAATFLVIAAKTTRGGWRWRWGKDD